LNYNNLSKINYDSKQACNDIEELTKIKRRYNNRSKKL